MQWKGQTMSALLQVEEPADLDRVLEELEDEQSEWLGTDQHAGRQARVAAPEALQSRSIDQIALAVAVGALPLSALRSSLENAASILARVADVNVNAIDGAEDSGCGSFLDRFLGAGVEPACEDALELFAVPRQP
jgi:hypothetical protein